MNKAKQALYLIISLLVVIADQVLKVISSQILKSVKKNSYSGYFIIYLLTK